MPPRKAPSGIFFVRSSSFTASLISSRSYSAHPSIESSIGQPSLRSRAKFASQGCDTAWSRSRLRTVRGVSHCGRSTHECRPQHRTGCGHHRMLRSRSSSRFRAATCVTRSCSFGSVRSWSCRFAAFSQDARAHLAPALVAPPNATIAPTRAALRRAAAAAKASACAIAIVARTCVWVRLLFNRVRIGFKSGCFPFNTEVETGAEPGQEREGRSTTPVEDRSVVTRL